MRVIRSRFEDYKIRRLLRLLRGDLWVANNQVTGAEAVFLERLKELEPPSSLADLHQQMVCAAAEVVNLTRRRLRGETVLAELLDERRALKSAAAHVARQRDAIYGTYPAKISSLLEDIERAKYRSAAHSQRALARAIRQLNQPSRVMSPGVRDSLLRCLEQMREVCEEIDAARLAGADADRFNRLFDRWHVLTRTLRELEAQSERGSD